MRSPVWKHSAAVLAASLCAACGMHRGPVVRPPGVQLERTVLLNGHAIRVHMADQRDRVEGVRPLLLYSTGDRGWAGKDLDVYRHLVAWGYPVAGFDAHDYVKHLGSGATTTPQRLARDYEAILRVARAGLELASDVPVVLVGVSRGADLAVVAAGQPALRSELDGVVAVALTREEEYVKRFRRRRSEPEMIQLYEYLPRLGGTPITVIQSTHDNYLPASEARTLFGPDTPLRHLVPIDARNHSFAGARDRLYAAMREAIDGLAAAMRR